MDKDFQRFLNELILLRKSVAKKMIDLADYWALEREMIRDALKTIGKRYED